MILSPSYIASSWCMMEAHVAQHRLVQENRQSILVVRLEEVPDRLVTKGLSYLLQNITYLAWPRSSVGEDQEREFWQKMKYSIIKKSASYSNMIVLQEGK